MAQLRDSQILGNLTITGLQKGLDVQTGTAIFNQIQAQSLNIDRLRSFSRAIPIIISRGTQTVGTIARGANIITPVSFTLARPMRILANATISNRPGGDPTGSAAYIYIDMRMNGTIFSLINMNNNSASTHIRTNQMFGLVDLSAGTHEFRIVLNNIISGTRNFSGADSGPTASWELSAFENI